MTPLYFEFLQTYVINTLSYALRNKSACHPCLCCRGCDSYHNDYIYKYNLIVLPEYVVKQIIRDCRLIFTNEPTNENSANYLVCKQQCDII